ncbi:MAG: NAD-dependent epimerase/dehydratase family protein [Deltaproteobacteria bacterium]|nr:NAD-dependent epimerase/dehydratase family protein [Deltaproteobacteria bacterium]MDQ3299386.1 NAD-dependent epimerase/dehydratase family protein [Myxococcota bacterium]
MSNARFRAGMVGAGSICEFHVAAVKKLQAASEATVDLVGIADLDAERAFTNAEKWGTQAFADLDALVAAGANVIHVLTPPSTHAKVAMAALERGCHVIIEKPVAEDPEDATKIEQLAKQKGLTVTVNHALLYVPQITRALDSVKAGALGQIVSVDILHGAEYPSYEGGPLPPWYRDAGYPFRDLGVHCLDLIQELLGPIEDVDADWRSLGGDPNLAFDEWRAMVRCTRGLAQFQLTWNTKPMQSQLIIHGTKGILRVDLSAMFHGKQASRPLPKVFERLVNAFADSLQPLIGGFFARKEIDSHEGLRELVADFYRRLAAGEPPPVSVADAGNVVHWVAKVARAADADHEAHQARFQLSESVPYLVTGASGSLGKAIVAQLRNDGHEVRVFQRRMPSKPQDGLEYALGNLGDPVAVDRAVNGAEIVIHCGAATKGGWPEHRGSTVVGTQNVIDACTKYGVKQLVHISSMSVIDWAGSAGKGNVTEATATEPRAEERGAYTRAKLEAEKLVSNAAKHGLPAVILRPGQIFGGGIPLINGAVARGAGGRWVVLGDGKLELPLVYIDDVVDAVMASIDKQLTRGEIIQIIDPDHLTQEEVLGLAGGTRGIVRVPRAIVFALGRLGEISLGALGKPSPIGVYRLQSALARLHYESDRAASLLGWQPRVGVREGIRRVTNPTSVAEPVKSAPVLRAVSG